MKVTEKDVAYIADLANLELTADERSRMVRDLNSILDHVDKLNQLDTGNVEPMAQVLTPAASDVMRDDTTQPSLNREDVMRNAPNSDQAFFKVPKVIEKG